MTQIDDYLAGLAPAQRIALEHIRTVVRQEVPEAIDGWSYAMPTLKYRGHGLVGFLAYPHHLGFYPFGSAPIEAVKMELEGYKTSKGAVQFTVDKPLPEDVLVQMIKLRAAQIMEKPPKKA